MIRLQLHPTRSHFLPDKLALPHLTYPHALTAATNNTTVIGRLHLHAITHSLYLQSSSLVCLLHLTTHSISSYTLQSCPSPRGSSPLPSKADHLLPPPFIIIIIIIFTPSDQSGISYPGLKLKTHRLVIRASELASITAWCHHGCSHSQQYAYQP